MRALILSCTSRMVDAIIATGQMFTNAGTAKDLDACKSLRDVMTMSMRDRQE